jgi:SAM-dependent methyltransferase
MQTYSYVGSELELFRHARNWKEYYYRQIKAYLGESVLEVGAGMGGTTQVLCRQSHQRWLCLEPDPQLVEALEADSVLPPLCEVQQGTINALPQNELFDTIIYIDVLEHIEDDYSEVNQAKSHLKIGGNLVVLSPAHQWLFSPFDGAIGHYRRYNETMYRRLSKANLTLTRVKYLDSVGLLASFSNRWLKQSMPTLGQIKLWDTWMVPVSRLVDPIFRYKLGKSILGIWQRN